MRRRKPCRITSGLAVCRDRSGIRELSPVLRSVSQRSFSDSINGFFIYAPLTLSIPARGVAVFLTIPISFHLPLLSEMVPQTKKCSAPPLLDPNSFWRYLILSHTPESRGLDLLPQ